MAAPPITCCPIGPVPFKDVVAGDDHCISSPKEHEDTISTLPSATALGLRLRQYQGVWLLHEMVPGVLSIQRRFVPRPGDVLLASPPKCGTTWLKALSFATMARASYPPSGPVAEEHPLLRLNPHDCVPFIEDCFSAGQDAKVEALPSPRLMQTHMHHSLLPAAVADNPHCKIIYVCREPKDMLVSMWHFVGAVVKPRRPLPELFELACEGKIPTGPIWDHVLGYWRASKVSPDRVMFLRYEEMLLDPVGTVRELARFVGVPFTAAEEEARSPADIAKLCSFETLKGVAATMKGSPALLREFQNVSFFRKGVVGDWANHLTPEMAQRFDAIMEDKLRGSGLTFN